MIPPIKDMAGAFSVAGLNVVVTGGNRGIGLGIAQAFAQSGANVAILCRNEESGKKGRRGAEKVRGDTLLRPVRHGQPGQRQGRSAAVYDVFKTVDVLVNNAGVSTVTKFLDDKDLAEWAQGN
jgi:NAD(P)-dependent dehydrogenase (short-subunit alcohol dehydrogenase family)